jgi:hypothetical protein
MRSASLSPAAPHRRSQIDECAAAADVRLPLHARNPLRSCNASFEPKLSDPEAADANVEAGEDRPRLLARNEPWKAVEDEEIGLEIVDDEAVRDPLQRAPFDIDTRGLGEQTPRVVDPDVAKAGLVPDGAVDPADADLQAGAGAQRGDAVRQEAVPRIGIQEQEESGRGGDQR